MNKKVMIIEDNKSVLQMLSAIVRELDSEIDVFEFLSLEYAYDTALENTIDLFLVDIILKPEDRGDISGIRFVDKIRTVAKYEFTPIVFISSLEDPKFYAYSELHSLAYLEKPFKAEQVKKIVSKALRFPGTEQQDKRLLFRKDGILYSINRSEILYIENTKHKVYFHKVGGDIITIPYKTLKQILAEADDSELLQCSRSVIVNKEYIESIDFLNRYIKLKEIENPINIGTTHLKKLSRIFK